MKSSEYTKQMEELIRKQLSDSRAELIRDLKKVGISENHHPYLIIVMRKFMQIGVFQKEERNALFDSLVDEKSQ